MTENVETVSNSACNKILQEAGESENAESESSVVSDCEENIHLKTLGLLLKSPSKV